MLPVIAVLALQLGEVYHRRQKSTEAAAMDAARDLIGLADQQVRSDLAFLELLSKSPSFSQENWDDGRAFAASVVNSTPGWISVSLADHETRRVIFEVRAGSENEGAPPAGRSEKADAGAVAESSPASEEVWRQIGGVAREGPGCPCVRLTVRPADHPELSLTALIDPAVYQAMMMSRIPAHAVAGVVDRDALFISRSIDYAQRVGTPGTEYVREAVRTGTDGFYQGETFEGLVNYTAFARSRLSGWSAHVAIDRALVDQPRVLSAATLLIGAIAALVIGGGMIAYVVFDIAERRREEARLAQLQKTEALGQFTSMVVHDFRNLLAVMQAALRQIARRSKEPETIELAGNAQQTVERGVRLTNQLLSFARSDGEHDVSAISLTALIDGLEEVLTKTLGPQIALEWRVAPDAEMILGNRDQLELAFINLAANARDAMEGSGAFSILAGRREDEVEIRVADTGPGVPEAQRRRIFEPFFTTKSEGKGTGLGLAQVAGAARNAGGSIELAEDVESGAVFILRLPAHVPDEADGDRDSNDDGDQPDKAVSGPTSETSLSAAAPGARRRWAAIGSIPPGVDRKFRPASHPTKFRN